MKCCVFWREASGRFFPLRCRRRAHPPLLLNPCGVRVCWISGYCTSINERKRQLPDYPRGLHVGFLLVGPFRRVDKRTQSHPCKHTRMCRLHVNYKLPGFVVPHLWTTTQPSSGRTPKSLPLPDSPGFWSPVRSTRIFSRATWTHWSWLGPRCPECRRRQRLRQSSMHNHLATLRLVTY